MNREDEVTMEAKHWQETRRRKFTNDGQGPGVGALFGRFSDEFARLLLLEVQLAKTEVSEKVSVVGQNAGKIAGGAVAALVGLTVLAMAIGYLLGTFMPVWLGFLITAVIFIAVGGALASAGIKTLKNTPMQLERTAQTLEEDTQWVRQEAEEVKRDPAHLGHRP